MIIKIYSSVPVPAEVLARVGHHLEEWGLATAAKNSLSQARQYGLVKSIQT